MSNVLESVEIPSGQTVTVLTKQSRLMHILTVTTATKLIRLYRTMNDNQ